MENKEEIDFTKMSKSGGRVTCWLCEDDEGLLDVTIGINRKQFYCKFDNRSFYKELLEHLKLVNLTSFTLTIYSNEGEINSFPLTVVKLEEQLVKWKEKRFPIIQDIRLIINL